MATTGTCRPAFTHELGNSSIPERTVVDALEELAIAEHDRGDAVAASGTGVRLVSVAELPTRFGEFRVAGFSNDVDGKEHLAIIKGDVVGAQEVFTRLHSECLTGDALGSLRCDCRDQLEAALDAIGQRDRGLVLYLRQEGRGIGLLNKLRAYALQDQGLDTVDANLALGFANDERDYRVASQMLGILQVESIRLMTNNPDKVRQLCQHGTRVIERIPHALPPNPHNLHYLRTKAERSGHLIDLDAPGLQQTLDERKAGK